MLALQNRSLLWLEDQSSCHLTCHIPAKVPPGAPDDDISACVDLSHRFFLFVYISSWRYLTIVDVWNVSVWLLDLGPRGWVSHSDSGVNWAVVSPMPVPPFLWVLLPALKVTEREYMKNIPHCNSPEFTCSLRFSLGACFGLDIRSTNPLSWGHPQSDLWSVKDQLCPWLEVCTLSHTYRTVCDWCGQADLGYSFASPYFWMLTGYKYLTRLMYLSCSKLNFLHLRVWSVPLKICVPSYVLSCPQMHVVYTWKF